TTAGLLTDTIVQVVVILAAAIGFSRPPRSPIPAPVWLMSAAILAAMLLQFVPFPAGVLDALRPALVGTDASAFIGDRLFSTISLRLGRTLEAFLFVLAPLLFFLAVMRLGPEQVIGLLPFFFLGLACNGMAGTIQYSLAG